MTVLKVPITKAGNKTLDVDYDKIPQDMLELVTIEGLKPLLNRRMSKITVKGLEGEQLTAAHSAALTIAAENLDQLYASAIKKGRSAAATTADGKKVSGVVMTRARNDAKAVVKNEIRNAGGKVSHYEASEITAAANELLKLDSEGVAAGTIPYADSFIGKAEAIIAALTAKTTSTIELDSAKGADAKAAAEAHIRAEAEAKLAKLGGIKPSPKLVEKAAEKRAKAKTKAAADGTISAKQAGMTAKAAPRKGSAPQAQA